MKRKRTNNDRFKCNICGTWIMKELYDKHYMSKRCLSKSKNGKKMILPPTLIPYVNYLPNSRTEVGLHTQEEQEVVGLPIPHPPNPTQTPIPTEDDLTTCPSSYTN